VSIPTTRIVDNAAAFLDTCSDCLEGLELWDYASADEARERLAAAYKRLDQIIRRAADKAANAALTRPEWTPPKVEEPTKLAKWVEGGGA
jgi:hypothetical protein